MLRHLVRSPAPLAVSLGEPLGMKELYAMTLSFAGVALALRPSSS